MKYRYLRVPVSTLFEILRVLLTSWTVLPTPVSISFQLLHIRRGKEFEQIHISHQETGRGWYRTEVDRRRKGGSGCILSNHRGCWDYCIRYGRACRERSMDIFYSVNDICAWWNYYNTFELLPRDFSFTLRSIHPLFWAWYVKKFSRRAVNLK